jgi:hypothetical protein
MIIPEPNGAPHEQHNCNFLSINGAVGLNCI